MSLQFKSCPTLCGPMDCSTPGFPVLHYLPEFAETHAHGVGDASHLFHPVVPFSSLQSFPASLESLKESVLPVRWPKCWSFSFNISSFSECSELISFRIDWLDLLAVQVTLKSLQHHSSKASILWCSAFFIVQLSHPYTTTGKTIALTRWIFVGKIMPLLFNMLSRF